MAEIVLDGVSKRFDDGYEAVKDMNLTIEDGEFVILVGPSGCGKSTALRMIAGLEDITDGELRIGGDVVNQYAPKDRDIAMVFQNYALYPHMTVRENMAFPLKLAKVPQEEITQKVEEAAKILDLEQHLDRKPANLSGGQRQRVAMGRAIVRDPKAFLMDEPLSNLDAKLRVQMRTEVSRLQKSLATTTVYVTHDQTEAMTLGDRVAVMRAGELQQVGPPGELYDHPANLFVAGFIGSPAMNFMPATLEGETVKLPFGDVRLPDELRGRLGDERGRDVIAGIRPESFEDASLVGDLRDQGHVFKAKIDLIESMGSELYVYFEIETEGVESKELEELAADSGAAEVPGCRDRTGRRPPRAGEQGRARAGGRALARHLEAPSVRSAERRAARGRRELSYRAAMRWAIAVAAALALLASATATARGAQFTAGSAGVGDPFFPDQGNGGYDVAAYDLDLAYNPGSKRAARDCADHGRRDPGSEPVRPRLSRPADRIGVRGRCAGGLHPAGPGARDHPAGGDSLGNQIHGRGSLPRRRQQHQGPRRGARRLDPHGRRGRRPRRAAGRADLVSV